MVHFTSITLTLLPFQRRNCIRVDDKIKSVGRLLLNSKITGWCLLIICYTDKLST